MAKDELDSSFGFVVYDIARLLRRRFTEQASVYDLTLAQNRALLHLYRNQGINQSTLADILEIQPITLLRQLDKLEQKGLIERRADPNDRRMHRLYPTPRADALVESLAAIGTKLTQNAFKGVSKRDQAMVLRILHGVKSNLADPLVDGSAQQGEEQD